MKQIQSLLVNKYEMKSINIIIRIINSVFVFSFVNSSSKIINNL
jgi:hypothetical protein